MTLLGDIKDKKVLEYGASVGTLSRDRKSVVQGKSVDLGGRRIIKKKKHLLSRWSVKTISLADDGNHAVQVNAVSVGGPRNMQTEQ